MYLYKPISDVGILPSVWITLGDRDFEENYIMKISAIDGLGIKKLCTEIFRPLLSCKIQGKVGSIQRNFFVIYHKV